MERPAGGTAVEAIPLPPGDTLSSGVRKTGSRKPASTSVPASNCECSAGTLIVADTSGYHKQLKPSGGERVLMVTEYTSGTPFFERPIEIVFRNPDELTRDQRFALDRNP